MCFFLINASKKIQNSAAIYYKYYMNSVTQLFWKSAMTWIRHTLKTAAQIIQMELLT